MTSKAGPPRALVVMGVSGSGKSTLGRAVARALGWRYLEGDLFHPPQNIERMRAGIPLGDAERGPWLDALAHGVLAAQAADEGVVLACSALKRSYRQRLRAAVPGLRFAHLSIDPASARRRVNARAGHFMPSRLLDSQFACLEDPSGEPGVLLMDATLSRGALRRQLCAWLGERG
ncbi:gluconokinase [Pseudomonas benzenivorans]|uniref:gluconokinase n=1 Tax=Pseudomonas benzenivorans TaxID=556533 RepID=UPI0035199989